jgi:hypothetical protein
MSIVYVKVSIVYVTLPPGISPIAVGINNNNNEPLPQTGDVKYLGIHLDKRLIWHKHIFTKQKHLGITLTKLYWLLGCRSKLSLSNKLLIYKVAIKPIWTSGIQLWGAASTSNIEILERFESKAPRLITDASWHVSNTIIRRELQVPSVKEEIRRLSAQYYAGLCTDPNLLATQLSRQSAFRRLRRHLPSDLSHRFTV